MHRVSLPLIGAMWAGIGILACSSSDSTNGSSSDGSTGSTHTGGAASGGAGNSGGTGSGSAPSGGTESTGGSAPSGGAGSGGAQSTGGSAPSGGAGSGSVGNGGTGGSEQPPLPPALTWTHQGPMRLVEGIWGSGRDDIYAVGRNGNLSHSTGDGTWTDQDTDTTANLTGIWGSAANDIYVSVKSNFVLHSTGDGEWEHQEYEDGYTFDGIWGYDADNIFLIGPGVVRGGGLQGWGSAQSVSNAAPTMALWGSSPTDLYVTLGGAALSSVYRSSGTGTWQPQAAAPQVTADSIWGLDASHIWVGATYQVLFSTGNGDFTLQLTTPTPQRVNAIWGAGPDAVYACTQGGFFYRSNGHGTWSEGQEIALDVSATCYAMWGTGPDNVFVGTSAGIYHGTPE